jgi:hypothetical protein
MESRKNSIDDCTDASGGSKTNNQGTSSSESSATSSECKKRQLQMDFEPSNHSVVCGRSKEDFDHAGNHRFRILARIFVETYSQAATRSAKSAIVSKIITTVRQAGGHFCKYESGAWFEVGDHYARKKVTALLRDLLHTQYRSSAKAKIARRPRKPIKDEDQQSDQKQVKGTEDSDDTSATSSCWEHSLGFEYWLEDSDDLFDINVF